jgi:UDP:flavonoid glycosyltransferase YjiC (YdhE family)
VYLTLGTIAAADEALVPAIEGLARLDADVLVALGSATGTSLGPLPGNVHVEAFVDQPGVLRHADLAVHHGGSGTLLACLATGTPQLLLPKGADQFLNADAVTTARIAPILEPPDATAERIGAVAAELLGVVSPAATLAGAELATLPEPHEVVAEIIARFDLVAAA